MAITCLYMSKDILWNFNNFSLLNKYLFSSGVATKSIPSMLRPDWNTCAGNSFKMHFDVAKPLGNNRLYGEIVLKSWKHEELRARKCFSMCGGKTGGKVGFGTQPNPEILKCEWLKKSTRNKIQLACQEFAYRLYWLVLWESYDSFTTYEI